MTLTYDITLTRAALDAEFEREQVRMRQHGLDKMRGFIDSGLRYQKFRALLERRNELHPIEERTSFYEWVEDPENRCDSGVLLSVQTVDIFCDYFKLPDLLLTKIGRAKFGELNPELTCWIRAIASGKRTFEAGQAAAIEWLLQAENNSVTALHSLIKEHTIGYKHTDGENASTPPYGAETSGWTVLREPYPVKAGIMRGWTAEEWRINMGIEGTDIPDDRSILTSVTAAPEESL